MRRIQDGLMRWTRIRGYVYSLISRERCLGGLSIAWDGKKRVCFRQKQNSEVDLELPWNDLLFHPSLTISFVVPAVSVIVIISC